MSEQTWQPMETAPKGSVGLKRNDDNYIQPPKILLLFALGLNDEFHFSVGYWDWYYAENGRGYEGGEAWIEPISGERLDLNYDPPIGWMEIPPPKEPENV